jgi:tyrosine-protein kinase Etk/Wzc
MKTAPQTEDQRFSGLHRPFSLPPPPEPASDVVDVVQLWSTVRQNYRFVLAIAVLAFAVVMAFTLGSRMQFRSSGRLYLGELDEKARTSAAANGFDFAGGVQGDVGSEVEILRSRSLITQAIYGAGLNVAITPSNQAPPRYYRWLWSRRDPALIDTGVRELRAVDAALAPHFREAQAYSVRFSSNEDFEVTSERGSLGRGKLGQPFKNRDFNMTLVRGFDRGPTPNGRYELVLKPLDEVMDRALDVLEVTAPRAKSGAEPAKVLTLEFIEGSPRLAASFLEQLMLAYLKERQAWKTEDATAAEAFVGSQLKGMKESLDQVQQKLADYRSNNRVVVLDNEAKAMIEQIAKYEEQRLAMRLEVAALSDVKRLLKDENAPMGAYLLGEAKDTVLEGMAASLTEARRKLTDLETRFSDAAPDVKEQRAQVAAQLESVMSYVGSRLTRAEESLGTLNGIISQFEAKLKTVPGAELGLAQLSRESEVYSRTYSYLLERQQQAAIVRASTLSKNRILDAPRVPQREYSPKLVLRAASGVVGLVLGVAIVLLRSFFAGTLQSESDVRKAVGGTMVLGSVPRRRRVIGFERSSDAAPNLDVSAGHPDCRFIESFRTLRQNLYRSTYAGNEGATLVLVTSPSPGDGKTTCVRWLAAVLAADGRSVLVVDADLRKDTWYSMHDDENAVGLCAVLTGRSSFQEVVREVALPSGGFHMLEAGGSVRPELLTSDRMIRFLREARESYDFVLIDSPSFPFVSDALVLSGMADWVLSVLRLENTPRKLAVEHVRRLTGSSLSYAVVINDVRPISASGAYPSERAERPKRPPGKRGGRARFWVAAAIALGLTGGELAYHQHARASALWEQMKGSR